MSTSRRNARSRGLLLKDKTSSLQYIDGSLPIRTTTTSTSTPIPDRPAPTTLQPSHQTPSSFITPSSNSSASSSKSSTRIFDEQAPSTRAESPNTPPESPLILGSNTTQKSIHIASECSPLPKAIRRSKKSLAVPGGVHLTNRKNAPRHSGIHSAPPPPFPSSVTQITVTHSRSVSNPEGSLCSSVYPKIDVSKNGSESSRPNLKFRDRSKAITIPDSDEESDGYLSDADEGMSANVPNITLKSSEDEQQEEDEKGSDDGDIIMRDAAPITDTPEGHSNVGHQELVPLNFTRYGAKEKNLISINISILGTMKKQRKPKKSESEKDGWTYIFESTGAPGYLKIGVAEDVDQRQKALERCFGELLRVEDYDMDAFDFYGIVESLIKNQLHNQRRKLVSCHCGTKHEEWYEVSKENALKSIHRWRSWIKEQKPYDEKGNLTPFWARKVRNTRKIASSVDWDDWIQPNWWECIDFGLEQSGKDYYVEIKAHFGRKDKHFWQVGIILLLCMELLYGRACSALILISLIFL